MLCSTYKRAIDTQADHQIIPTTPSSKQGVPTDTSTPSLPAFMNTVPHPREMRQFFYADVSDAVVRATQTGISRMSVRLTIPETNPEMDVYRIGEGCCYEGYCYEGCL